MKTDNTILKDILRLDSIYGLLKWQERIYLQGYILGREWAELPKRIEPLIEYLEKQSSYCLPVLKVDAELNHYADDVPLKEYVKKTVEMKCFFENLIR